VRRKIAQGLGEAQRLLEESKFEAEPGELETFQRSIGDAQVIFLVLLSLAYQRRASGRLLADLPAAVQDLEEAVAATLERLADPTRANAAGPPADLTATLHTAENALASVRHRAPADEVATAVEQRLELYRTLVRLVSHLDPWRTKRSLVHTIGGADRAPTNAEHRP
jgi:hypothetical protein